MTLGAGEILGLVVIVLLLFGSTRLPKLARSMREAREEFNKGSSEAKPDAGSGDGSKNET